MTKQTTPTKQETTLAVRYGVGARGTHRQLQVDLIGNLCEQDWLLRMIRDIVTIRMERQTPRIY